MTIMVISAFRVGLVTMPPKTLPSSAAVLYCVMEPVTYLTKYTTNQPEMVV